MVGDISPMTLMEFYRTEYSMWNWILHGSAFVALRHTTAVSIVNICSLQHLTCADIALHCCTLVAREYKLTDTMPQLANKGRELQEKRSVLVVKLVEEAKKNPPSA